MDGYHWPRAVLETFPDPEETLRRRGAPHTFDAASFLALVQAIRQPLVLGGHPAAIHGPTFDHAIKDPVPNGVTIIQSHRLVVFEGLYIQLQSTPIWEEIPPLMDEQWWVECPESTCRERLINRHITSGICKNSVDAAHRADTNDIVNGRFVLKHRIVAVTNILYNG
ncbi:hypothetical protein IWQ62_000187 [Dispira parvispora]|uniref:Phosphoribulokinase n=1 Tax=Dispira parvispora TaxID=1520584 RepID=A0A9W8E5A4_9FUNG|nr:hypothetical protein IWQ62_000187 [Dispira parvispora]